MLKRMQFIIFCFFTLVAYEGASQDTIPETDTDTRYREDQFYLGATYNLLSNIPSGIVVRGLSGGFQFGYLRDMPINDRRNIAVALGLGLSFNEYGQNLFIGERANEETIFTVLDAKEVNYTRNRFSTSAIEAPFEFRWRTSTPENYRFWRIYAGFKVGYVYWYKATFKQPGNNVNQTNIPEFEKIRLGTTLSFGYNSFNFFAYYSINPFFKDAMTTDGEAVNFRTIRVGLMFYIL